MTEPKTWVKQAKEILILIFAAVALIALFVGVFFLKSYRWGDCVP